MDSFLEQGRQIGFAKGLLNAAGMLGFIPEAKKAKWWGVLDAFVTNPISYRPRRASGKRGFIEFSGGVLLHSGYPNPGFKQSLQKFGGQWASADIPIIPALIEEDASRLGLMVRQLEEIDNVLAIELLLGEDFSAQLVRDLCQAAQGELAIIANIPMERTLELAEEALGAGAAAISLGPSRGTMMNGNRDGEMKQGRLYGKSQFPRALHLTQQLAQAKVPIIGGNGIFDVGDAKLLLAAGALAVQLDTALWKADWDADDWRLRED